MPLNETGFKRRTFDDIITAKTERSKELFGEDMETDELSVLGKYNRINAYDQALTEELAEKIYNSILNSCNFDFISLKHPYLTKSTAYWHGSENFFGQSGSQQEKLAKNFKQSTVVYGHTHSPCVRYDSYSIPCLCQLEQGYNTPANSNWGQGFAFVYEYKNESFCQIINFKRSDCGLSCFFDNKFHLNKDDNEYNRWIPRTIIDLTQN